MCDDTVCGVQAVFKRVPFQFVSQVHVCDFLFTCKTKPKKLKMNNFCLFFING